MPNLEEHVATTECVGLNAVRGIFGIELRDRVKEIVKTVLTPIKTANVVGVAKSSPLVNTSVVVLAAGS